jgi:hypothetical protein
MAQGLSPLNPGACADPQARRQCPGLRSGICIAAHCLDRRDLPEPGEHLDTSDIPGKSFGWMDRYA